MVTTVQKRIPWVLEWQSNRIDREAFCIPQRDIGFKDLRPLARSTLQHRSHRMRRLGCNNSLKSARLFDGSVDKVDSIDRVQK